MRYSKFNVCSVLTAVLLNASFAASTDLSPIGRSVSNFTLKDYRGKTHSLDDFANYNLLVVVVLGTECPLAKLYAPRLMELASEFKEKGVGFVGLNANVQDSITEVAAYARIHHIDFPILKDLGNRVADQLGAVRTPEVFVLDENRTIRYWGRIDDQYGVGYIREKPERHDLKEAISELLEGQQLSQPVTTSAGCYIGRVRQPDTSGSVTYGNQIARILQKRCVECHRDGDIAPFALTDYDEVVGWAETIREVVEDQRMPPWHADPRHGKFSNDRRLSEEEKQLIYRWVEAGAPAGNLGNLPEPIEFTEGWQLPTEPEMVVYMREQPYEVAAEGTIRYQYFEVDLGFEEDEWVKAVEVLPGNRAVVHHILLFTISPDRSQRDFGGGVRGFFAGYVPGLRAQAFPPGMAKRIPAGSKLVFQVHYTPIGSVQLDRSKVGFVFTQPEEIQYEVKTVSAFQPNIRIPRHEENHREVSATRIREPSQLLALSPHMHLRGKSFRYLARFPKEDGWTTLLDVPNYDFNWQTNYQVIEPIELPEGTLIKCIAHYDNSDGNLNNPDPNKQVRWGDQTWDEMMIGYFDVAVPWDSGKVDEGLTDKDRLELRAEEFVLQMDRDDDGRLSKTELPVRMRLLFIGADEDKDGTLTPEEVGQAFMRRRR